MDRFEAKLEIGNHMLIDENKNGKYIGELLDVITPQRKPWRGLVKIVAVIEFPEQKWISKEIISLKLPLYKENEIVEVPGNKIKYNQLDTLPASYETSVIASLSKLLKEPKPLLEDNKDAIDYIQGIINETFPNIKLRVLIKDSNRSKKKSEENSNQYIEYKVKQLQGNPVLINNQQDRLPLIDCPFELELLINKEWVKGYYTNNWLFEGVNGEKYLLKENYRIRLQKKYIEPYELLINELEKPSLDSLEKSLIHFNLTHNDLVSCHNELINQLLYAGDENSFTGVNFLLYQNEQQNVIVQHHFERHLVENGPDKVFDRFELTNSKGKRFIVTYTNQFSKDF